MRRGIVLSAMIAAGTLAVAGARGQQQEPKIVKMMSLGVFDTLYFLQGGGGNMLALIDESRGGVVLIDTKLPSWGRSILDVIRGITDLPVTTIINTHAHEDHTGSNSEFRSPVDPDGPVDIVAHENAKADLVKMAAFQGANAKFLPNKTYKDKMTLFDGLHQIDLYHFGPGHTSGDTIVVFPAKRVAYMGDLLPAKATPVIDRNNGGSGVAFPETLAKAAAGITGVDKVIPGHAPRPPVTRDRPSQHESPICCWLTWDDVREYADFNRDFLRAVQEAMRAGKSVDEAAASLKLPERYKDYGMEHTRANVQAIYSELKK